MSSVKSAPYIPLSAAVKVGFDADESGLLEEDLESLGLNRDEPISDTCSVRSGTNFRLVVSVDALFVCSRSGALSGDLTVDLDVGVLAMGGEDLLPVLEEDRRLQ